MASCLVGIGSNLGDRAVALDRALSALEQLRGTRVLARSRFHETRAVGGPADQPAFLNAAALLETNLDPLALLDELQRIERELGRVRAERWGPRAIDLDLLLYDHLVLASERLTLPHARLAWRRFALAPAAEVARDMLHPRIGWTIAELLANLDRAETYIALIGLRGAEMTELARLVADRVGARLVLDNSLGVAGSTLASELESLEARFRPLDKQTFERDTQLVVSDYWIGESLARARLRLSTVEMAQFAAEWEAANARVVAPKLIVFVDLPPRELAARASEGCSLAEHERGEAWLTRLRDELVALLERKGQGPVLALDQPSRDAMLDEIVAAIEAMK